MAIVLILVVAAWFISAALCLVTPVASQKKTVRHGFARRCMGNGLSRHQSRKVLHSIRMGHHVLVSGYALSLSMARVAVNGLVRDLFASLAEATVEGARIQRSYRETKSLTRNVRSLNSNRLGKKVAQIRKSLGIHVETVSTSSHQNRKNRSANRQAYRRFLNERMAAIPAVITFSPAPVVQYRRVGKNVAPREGTWAYIKRTERAIQARKSTQLAAAQIESLTTGFAPVVETVRSANESVETDLLSIEDVRRDERRWNQLRRRLERVETLKDLSPSKVRSRRSTTVQGTFSGGFYRAEYKVAVSIRRPTRSALVLCEVAA